MKQEKTRSTSHYREFEDTVSDLFIEEKPSNIKIWKTLFDKKIKM